MKTCKSLLDKTGWDDFKQSTKDAFLFPILAPYNMAGASKAWSNPEDAPLNAGALIGTAIGVTIGSVVGIAQLYGYYSVAKEGFLEPLALPAATNLVIGYQNIVNSYRNRKK